MVAVAKVVGNNAGESYNIEFRGSDTFNIKEVKNEYIRFHLS